MKQTFGDTTLPLFLVTVYSSVLVVFTGIVVTVGQHAYAAPCAVEQEKLG